jgi:PHD/YefM family antitoxin component YafN of YafNO toxin-antitoxin module
LQITACLAGAVFLFFRAHRDLKFNWSPVLEIIDAHVEEKLMLDAFGDRYRDYRSPVKPFFFRIAMAVHCVSAISKECHENGEPVFLTKNGRGDLVVMSIEEYERKQGRLELNAKLEEAEAESRSSAESLGHDEMLARLRERLNAE